MNSKSNGAGERQTTKKSNNFDSEPADDGFRNYMARKIELQRKQFGLVLPPPPPTTSEPPPILMGKPNTPASKKKDQALLCKNHVQTPTITDMAPTSIKKKIKYVRFHENVEIEGVSQVLKDLQRKHDVEKSKKRKLQSPPSNSDSVDNEIGKSDNECETILGVLNDLQKRHGAFTSKKKRRSKCIDRTSLERMEPILEDVSSDIDSSTCDSPGHSHSQEHSPQHLKTHTPRIEPGRTPHRPDLFFTGVVVLVNGHTSPDTTTIMRLLHKHGGDLEKYETRRVTHIIAEQLSWAKSNIYKHQQNPTPVCRPEWITESVECGKLLPFADYLLENVRNPNTIGTKSVKSFFGKKTPPTDNIHELIDNTPSPKNDMNILSTDEQKSENRWHDTNPSETNYHLKGQVRTVGNDPNFLESYFSNSRLSYIGSFKQRVKQVKQAASSSKSSAGSTKFILLVDMDCFFASVALRKYPQYVDKPVAVGHSHVDRPNNTTLNTTRMKNSSSELSTCNYIARKCGIRKGMFLGDAIQLCPDLIVLPYDFDGYEEVSGAVADLLHNYAEQYNGCVEQVSCDESYVEIHIKSNDVGDDVFAFVNTLAENIRTDIVRYTSCTASIGIGPNKFLAKLAADRVKPNACCVVRDWRKFLDNQSLRELPGIGRKLETKLQPYGLCTINDIWELNQDAASVVGEIIGVGNATKIVQFCNGMDDRIVTPAIRKSIGAECNYGVRFDGPYGIDYMMNGLAKEIHSRMTKAAVRGTKLVLKLMKSKDTSKLPGKFLGHGSCDSLSRSIDISLTREQDVIFSAAIKLYEKIGVDDSSIRGVGIVINSLKSDDEASTSSPSKLFEWLQKDNSAAINDSPSYCETMPSFSQLDQDVLSNLPEDVLAEVKSTYGKTRNNISSLPNESKSWPPQKDKSISIVGQPSVRRMLKLACIKSGDEELGNNDFTLSQLDRLPMERQLQLANGDAIEIVKGSKCRTNKIATTDHIDATDDEILPFLTLQDDEGGRDSPKELPIINFHHANVKPLREFILANPKPDSQVVDTVHHFFSVCIHERRIDDVVILLRLIKNMNDGWNYAIYSRLRISILDLITFTTGDALDVRWLGL